MSANLKNYAVSLLLVPLILSVGLAPALPFVDAFEISSVCDNNQILVERSTNGKYACVNSDTAKKWIASGFANSDDEQFNESMSFANSNCKWPNITKT